MTLNEDFIPETLFSSPLYAVDRESLEHQHYLALHIPFELLEQARGSNPDITESYFKHILPGENSNSFHQPHSPHSTDHFAVYSKFENELSASTIQSLANEIYQRLVCTFGKRKLSALKNPLLLEYSSEENPNSTIAEELDRIAISTSIQNSVLVVLDRIEKLTEI